MNEINQINNEPVRKSRILLVDDEPGLRTAVKTFLKMKALKYLLQLTERMVGKKLKQFFPI